MNTILATPISFGRPSGKDFEATVQGRTEAYWDDSYTNKTIVGDKVAFVQNAAKGNPSRILATATVTAVYEDTDATITSVVASWIGHTKDRNVLVLSIDETPIIQGTFEEVFIAGGKIQGTCRKKLK